METGLAKERQKSLFHLLLKSNLFQVMENSGCFCLTTKRSGETKQNRPLTSLKVFVLLCLKCSHMKLLLSCAEVKVLCCDLRFLGLGKNNIVRFFFKGAQCNF